MFEQPVETSKRALDKKTNREVITAHTALTSSPPLCTGVKGNVQGNLFKIITQSDTHYFIQAPTQQDKMSWIDAIREQTM